MQGDAVVDHIFLQEGYGHFWTIPVEFKFYMAVPILLVFLTHVNVLKKYCSIVLFLIAVLCAVLFPYTSYVENSISLTWYLPVFFIGMITADIYTKIKAKSSKVYDFLVILILLGMLLSVPWVREVIWKIEPDGYLQNKYLYFGVAWGCIIIFIKQSVLIKQLLEHARPLHYIGKISFSIYIIHFLVLNYANIYIHNGVIKSIVVVVVSIIFAAIAERVVERPMKSVCDRICQKVKKIKWQKQAELVMIIFGLVFVVCCECNLQQKNTQEQASDWEDYLYVPTMINKCDDTYFIIDCWNCRILYSDKMSKNLKDWNTLTDEMYLGGHTVASDGELFVFDNTDMNEILVYKRNEDGFYLSQRMEGIEKRPHYVLYDEGYKKFFVIGSGNGTIYTFVNQDGILTLESEVVLDEIKDAYVRSINVIDGDLYMVSGPGNIYQYEITDSGYIKKESYQVPDALNGMNQINKFGSYWYITVNSSDSEGVAGTTFVRASDLKELWLGRYSVLYDEMGFVGQPYFITYFDNKYYITEISETKGNGIKSFQITDDTVTDVETLWYWDEAADVSKERWLEQKNQLGGEALDLIVFMGQSNMSGKGDAASAPEVTRGYEFRAIQDPTTLYAITEPFGLNENNKSGIDDTFENGENKKMGGLVSSFANTYLKTTRIPIVALSCSEGATTIDQWMVGGDFYNDAVSRIECAKQFLNENSSYRLRHTYLVWCQGESDGDQNMSSEEYYQKLDSIVSGYVDNDYVEKVFIIRIGNYRDDASKYDEIIDAQTRLCKDSEDVILISTLFAEMKDLGLMKDEYHYLQEGYNLVGIEAGYYAGQFVNTGNVPDLWDYKYETVYSP